MKPTMANEKALIGCSSRCGYATLEWAAGETRMQESRGAHKNAPPGNR